MLFKQKEILTLVLNCCSWNFFFFLLINQTHSVPFKRLFVRLKFRPWTAQCATMYFAAIEFRSFDEFAQWETAVPQDVWCTGFFLFNLLFYPENKNSIIVLLPKSDLSFMFKTSTFWVPKIEHTHSHSLWLNFRSDCVRQAAISALLWTASTYWLVD